MFTGIIEEVGKVLGVKRGVHSSILTIQGSVIFEDLKLGDSVAVNGVCLTVSACSHNTFTADVSHETIRRSSLGAVKAGCGVNLERALPANGRLGGHFVSGHIDGTGVITKITPDDNAVWYSVKTPGNIMKYIVEKGSVAIDGVSLTVAELSANTFSVSIIPHTARATILSEKSAGDVVNLENDIIGKYIEKLLGMRNNVSSGITKDILLQSGFL